MNIAQEAARILKIDNPLEKINQLEGLDTIFEQGHLQRDEAGEAASLLLNAALAEQNDEVKETLLYITGQAIAYNRIQEYIDWDAILPHIPRLSGENLLNALNMLGWSKKQVYIPLLETYLDNGNISIQTMALDAICQIWWDLSNHDPEVKELMDIDKNRYISFLILNPRSHKLSHSQVSKLFFKHQRQVMENLKIWLKEHD